MAGAIQQIQRAPREPGASVEVPVLFQSFLAKPAWYTGCPLGKWGYLSSGNSGNCANTCHSECQRQVNPAHETVTELCFGGQLYYCKRPLLHLLLKDKETES